MTFENPWRWCRGDGRRKSLSKFAKRILPESAVATWLRLAFAKGFRVGKAAELHVLWVDQLQEPTELWKKKRFNLQAPPVYDRKVTNLFFSIIIVSIFFHNSVGDCMSIDSQFECILRGNIEL